MEKALQVLAFLCDVAVVYCKMRTSSSPQDLHGRNITFIRHNGKVHAVDSKCYHMGGPLAEGDIEELASGHVCITCPWHNHKVSHHCALLPVSLRSQ